MKTISVGDTHGTNHWQSIAVDNYDKIIFVGDYVDSFTISNLDIKDNLLNIIELKKSYPDKVVLLLGNHDLQYMFKGFEHRCSGYRPEASIDLYQIFSENKELFQVAFQIDKHIWSHAGFHKGWISQRFKEHFDGINTLADVVNERFNFHKSDTEVLFDVGFLRGGNDFVGGPFWLDARNLIKKPVAGLHQIVGHTRRDVIDTYRMGEVTSVTFIDVQEDTPNFYELKI